MLVFKHPKYYEELRKKAKKFQKEEREKNAKAQATSKQQAASVKQQATSDKLRQLCKVNKKRISLI